MELLSKISRKCISLFLIIVLIQAFIWYVVIHANIAKENIIRISNNWLRTKVNDSWEYEELNLTNEAILECPEIPPGLQGHINVSFSETSAASLPDIEEDNPMLSDGGYFRPPSCLARWKVAIIIPYRRRENHLRYFLQYMHPVMQRQLLEYRIYVINQADSKKFNRAKLMNVGFRESLKDLDFDCFVFHDVDLILENDKCLYRCYDQPRHLSVGIDKFDYKPAAKFGGVTQLTKKDFEKINGYPNGYWGWGGEDQDIWLRLRFSKMEILQDPVETSRYKMIPHGRDAGNEENPSRWGRNNNADKNMWKDGLNTLRYSVVSRETNKLFTKVNVNL